MRENTRKGPRGIVILKDRAVDLANKSDYYSIAFYCACCGFFIFKGDARRDRLGRPRCPFCGRNLRTKPRGGAR